MAIYLPNGATISVATTYGTAATVSALTNATEGVATLSASHGVIVGDILEVTSGWSKLSGRIVRAKTVATNDVTLEGVNTSSTDNYPSGSGIGTVREITAWTQISQILEAELSGGEQQFRSYSFLEDDTERQIPTAKGAQQLKLKLGDDSALSWYAALVAADEARTPRAIRVNYPNGAVIYYNGYVSFNNSPTTAKNEIAACECTFSLISKPTRY